MKSKKILSAVIAFAMVTTVVATLTVFASAKPATDATSVYVGETIVREELFGENPFSADEQDGNLWYLYTTDETILQVVDYYVEEGTLFISLKGVAVGDGVEIRCKQYDEAGASWEDDVHCINGIYNVVSAPTYLDLDSTTTDIKDSKELDQLYNATVASCKTDVTKVQVSWDLTDISATVTVNKIWDTENLAWIDNTGSASIVTADDVTAKFSFVNLSSVKVGAQVDFEAVTGITAVPTYTDNAGTADKGDGKIVLDTANTTEETYDNTGMVVVSVPVDKDYFETLTTDTTGGIYGTYTVTLKPVYHVTVEYFASDDSTDEEMIYAGLDVVAGTAITVDATNSRKITIGDESFTTAVKHTFDGGEEPIFFAAWWRAVFVPAPQTVDEDDMTIEAIYVDFGF